MSKKGYTENALDEIGFNEKVSWENVVKKESDDIETAYADESSNTEINVDSFNDFDALPPFIKGAVEKESVYGNINKKITDVSDNTNFKYSNHSDGDFFSNGAPYEVDDDDYIPEPAIKNLIKKRLSKKLSKKQKAVENLIELLNTQEPQSINLNYTSTTTKITITFKNEK